MNTHKNLYLMILMIGLIILTGCQGFRSGLDTLVKEKHCLKWEIDTEQDSSASYYSDQISFSTNQDVSGKIVVQNDAGLIMIRPSQWSNVYVKGDIYATTLKHLDQIDITSEIRENITYIEVSYANPDSLSGFTYLEVQVPSSLTHLEIVTQAADVEVSELNAKLTVNSPCGDIIANKIKGDMEIWSEYGDISLSSEMGNITAQNFAGDIVVSTAIHNSKVYDLRTNAGSIYFYPQNKNGDVEIKTVSGRIDAGTLVDTGHLVDDRGTLFDTGDLIEEYNSHHDEFDSDNYRRQSQTQQISGQLGPGSALILLETVNGDIYIR